MMEAGRELDALVAEKVMGWVVHHRNTAHYVLPNMKEYKVEALVNEWRPSQNIAAAWQVVEKMHERGEEVYIEYGFSLKAKKKLYYAWFDQRPGPIAQGETAPLAICQAAIHANGF